MPDQADERLSLPIEQGVLLWCIRLSVMEMRRPVGAGPKVADMLDRFGVPDAGSYLEGFLFALSRGSARMIDVRCTCATRFSADERTLLEVLGLAQDMRPFEALLALRGMVTPAGARAALRSAEGLGAVLAQAGRLLPAPDEELRHYAAAAPGGWAAGATLH